MYIDYRMNDENIQAYQIKEEIINTIKHRFKTYGYSQMRTSSFEKYDLYSQVSSSINQKEMIKVIDQTGEVLVLRPDVTIPITHQLAQTETKLTEELRYFYIQDVYRQTSDRSERIESTQAGIEYFGDNSAAADAEVIALAIQTLHDFGFKDIKIEMGHAGFFHDLIGDIDLSEADLTELNNLIQAKNGIDIVPFLENLSVDPELINAISKIPFLYGNPEQVGERAKTITWTDEIQKKLTHLLDVYDILKMYDMAEYVIMDLGLINQMGYYSDVIFQGFVEKFGQPMLMGGRYNHLGDAFGANIAAIGFAITINSITQALGDHALQTIQPLDVKLIYDSTKMYEAIQLANHLRAKGCHVISYPVTKTQHQKLDSVWIVSMTTDENTVSDSNNSQLFANIDELLTIMKGAV